MCAPLEGSLAGTGRLLKVCAACFSPPGESLCWCWFAVVATRCCHIRLFKDGLAGPPGERGSRMLLTCVPLLHSTVIAQLLPRLQGSSPSASSSSHRDISHHASFSSKRLQTENSQPEQVRRPVLRVSMSYHGNNLFDVVQVMSLLSDVRNLQRDKQ